MNLKEEVLRIKNLIYELSPQSSVVLEFMEQLQQLPELIKHLKFDSLKDVKDYVDMGLGVGDIMYVLLPYTSDKLSYGLPEKISKHLFNDGISDFMSEKSLGSEPNEFEVRKMIQDKIRDTFNLNIENFDFEYDEDEWSDIDEIKNKQRSPSLDELLEKIKEKGLNSLTEKELIYLNKYSN